jgi:hypothetical protein
VRSKDSYFDLSVPVSIDRVHVACDVTEALGDVDLVRSADLVAYM